MPERRYSDDEVTEIFSRATDIEHGRAPLVRGVEGRTLTELQEIGREAGIAPELVARAAHSLDEAAPAAPATFLGLPLRVAKTVSLRRRLTDAEWEQFVVDLRETFDARGTTRAEGSLRSWSNGNLQVLLEPDGAGHRIRFRTANGVARSLMFAGLGVLGVGVVAAIPALFSGIDPGELLSAISPMGVVGAALLATGALRLPGWARTRREQMDELGERIDRLTSGPDVD
jgi:hypothetical protein